MPTFDEWMQQGKAHQEAGRGQDALACYHHALALQPDSAQALSRLGCLCLDLGQTAQGVTLLRQALQGMPLWAEGYLRLGIALREEGEVSEAIAAFQKAARIRPGLVVAYEALGSIFHGLNRYSDAADAFRKVIKYSPSNAAANANLGICLCALGQEEVAMDCFRKALELSPDTPDIHYNLGSTLHRLGRFEQAVEHFRQALALNPGSAEYHNSLGCSQYAAGMRSDAMDSIRRAIELSWNGQPNPDGTLLISSDQGLGDAIQFVRYVPTAKQRYQGRVVLECQPSLCDLFRCVAGADAVVARDHSSKQPGFSFDARIGLANLPPMLDMTEETIPSVVPYLNVSPERQAYWRERLNDEGMLKVGLRWGGNPLHSNNSNRSIALTEFAPLAGIEGVRLFSLQQDDQAQQARVPPSGLQVRDFASELTDFRQTAALILNLDLVISVDTSVAHLAGALGKPVWNLLPYSPDLRWLLEREDTPWYPTMRLFRQPKPGDWQSVFARVAQELDALVRPSPPHPPSPMLWERGETTSSPGPLSHAAGEGENQSGDGPPPAAWERGWSEGEQ